MILGHIDNFEKEKGLYTPALVKGLRYLKGTDFSALELGRYALEGDDLFALVQQYATEPAGNRLAEAHRKYIDIQYIASGEEIIGYAPYAPDLPVHTDALAEKDAMFFGPIADETGLFLGTGMYAIFYPWDVHRPCCQTASGGTVRKVVVKVRLEP